MQQKSVKAVCHGNQKRRREKLQIRDGAVQFRGCQRFYKGVRAPVIIKQKKRQVTSQEAQRFLIEKRHKQKQALHREIERGNPPADFKMPGKQPRKGEERNRRKKNPRKIDARRIKETSGRPIYKRRPVRIGPEQQERAENGVRRPERGKGGGEAAAFPERRAACRLLFSHAAEISYFTAH